MPTIFSDLISEGGKHSHKRAISVFTTGAIIYGIVVVIHKYPDLIAEILWDAMIFVMVMSGVATIAQVASIITAARGKAASSTSETTEKTTETSKSN